MINENLLKGKWNEIKGDIQKRWGKLTNDDLDKAKGDLKNLAGVIQKRYGIAQEEIRQNINDFFERYSSSGDEDKNEPPGDGFDVQH